MASRLTAEMLQGRLFYLTVGTFIVGTGVALMALGYAGMTMLVFFSTYAADYSPPVFYPTDQTVPLFNAITVTRNGEVESYAVQPPPPPTATGVFADGEAVEVLSANNLFTVQLKERTLTPGTYRCADLTPTSEGVIDAIADGLPLAQSEFVHGNGTLEDALATEFLLAVAEPELDGSRVLALSPADFNVDTATPGLYQVSLIASPVATQTCTHPVFLAYGDGAKVLACVSGPAPGTPGGAVLLDSNGTIPSSFLPSVFESQYRGLYNPSDNIPPLSSGMCTAGIAFYYTASAVGNVTLGSFFTLRPRDLIMCFNETWTHIGCVNSAADSFNGRFGHVTPQAGDYTEDLIPFNNGTLQDFVDAPVVLWEADPTFVNGLVLEGEEGEIQVSNATFGLEPLLSLPPNGTLYPGFVDYLEVDRHGMIIDATSIPSAVESITGSPNQIIAGPGPDVVLSLPQDYHTDANPRFRTVSVQATTIVSSSNASIHFISTGVPEPVLGYGNQTLVGDITLTSTPTIRNGAGLRLNGPSDTGSATIRPSGTSDLEVFLPATAGNPTNVFTTDGAGQMSWTAAPNTQWTQYTPTVTSSGNVASVVSLTGYFLGRLTPGTLAEVIIFTQITRSVETATTSLDITVPTGIVGSLVTATRGFVTEPTASQTDFHGYVRQGFNSNDVRLTIRGNSAPKNGYWFAHLFYVVQ